MGAELASSCAGSALGWAWCARPPGAHRRAISEAWRRDSASSLATDPGPKIVESLQHLNLLPQTSVQSSQQFLAPQVNWGVSACNTHNEVSIALANFNYGSICFLIFPRWLDVFFFFPHNYKGTDCTVALCTRVRDSGCFFQIPLLRSVRSHRVAAADRCYLGGF